MCLRCDGFSQNQINDIIRVNIITHGWYVTGVLADEELRPSLGAHHGVARVLRRARAGLGGGRVEPIGRFGQLGRPEVTGGRPLGDLEADGIHHRGVAEAWLDGSELFNAWADYYCFDPPPGSFVQLLVPNGTQLDLSDPGALTPNWERDP